MYKVVESKDHGKVLLATTKLDPGPFGLLVFREEALLAMPTRGSSADKSGPVPSILAEYPQTWTDWWTYTQQPDEVKKKVLQMYTEMDCLCANVLRDYLINMNRTQEEKDAEDGNSAILDHIEEFVTFAMVLRFNSVELCPPARDGNGPGKDYGHGLFEKACKMSHSCKPNCVWLTTQDGRAKEIRAISTIEEGEELTIDYVGEVLEPIPHRRQELLITKGFLCECSRCAGKHGDDTRRFNCINYGEKNCSGVHFLHQPFLESEPVLLSCTKCGAKPPLSYTQSVLHQESKVLDEIREVENSADKYGIIEVSERVERLAPPHDLHCLADRCYELQAEMYSKVGDHRSAAKAYAKQINCRVAILGRNYHSQSTAFCIEKLGDELAHINVKEAEEAYKRSFRVLQMMRGGHEDPYTKCSLLKLMNIQNRRAHCESEVLPHQSGLQGIAKHPDGAPHSEYPCTLCGNPSRKAITCSRNLHYCCNEHMAIHLHRVHNESLSEEMKISLEDLVD